MNNINCFVTVLPLALIGWVAVARTQSGQVPIRPLAHRWFYCAQNLQVTENIPNVETLMRRAAKAGYNGMVLADYKLSILDRVPDWYFKNAARIKAVADELKLELIPCVFPIGYSNGLLAHDPNLVEAMPVKDAPFVVHDGKADIYPSAEAALHNGGFEEADGNRALGWTYQDDPGKISFIDRDVKHGGTASLRFGVPGAPTTQPSNWRITQKLALKPWRYYRLSFWIKTQDLASPGSFNVPILIPNSTHPSLSHLNYGVKSTQEWTLHQALFNSQQFTEAVAYLGVWGATRGAFWLDDVKLEELGLVNVVRRDGCPLVVKSADGTLFEEGRDFKPVKDEKLGTIPYAGEYELYHTPPAIELTPGSRIKEGQKLLVSFYHPAFVYDTQTACCLTHPKVYEILNDQMRRVEELFHPTAVFMSHDELRVANWCALCQERGVTPGKLLAENARRCTEIAHRWSARARLYVWSDMFDPFHNAHDDYYLVNGTWAGSWEGLAPSVGIVDWYFDARKRDLPFFANQGHNQILAGYYDNNVEYTNQWLSESRDIKGIDGVMYTTWSSRYDDLERFARAVWGGGQ